MTCVRRVLTSLLILSASALAADNATSKDVECYCTDTVGERVEMGVTKCMSVDGRVFMARCEMALNNPFWREVEGDCLSS